MQRLTNERASNLRDAVGTSCRLPKIKFSFRFVLHRHSLRTIAHCAARFSVGSRLFEFDTCFQLHGTCCTCSRHLKKGEFSKMRNQTCAVCGQCDGRTVSCSVANCPRSFHILCAWYEGLFIRCQKDNIAKVRSECHFCILVFAPKAAPDMVVHLRFSMSFRQVGCGRLGGDDFTFDVFCSSCTPDVFQDFSQEVSQASRRRFRNKEKRLVAAAPRARKRSAVDAPEVLHQASRNLTKRLAQAVDTPDAKNDSNRSDKPQAPPLPTDLYSPDVCAVCFNAHPVSEALVGCDRCSLHVHPSCGAVELTKSASAGRHGKGRAWVCAGCDAGATDAASLDNSFLLLNRSVSSSGATTGDASSHSVRCLLCPRRGGVVLPSAQIASMFVHIACSIHVPGCSITSDGRIATPTQPAAAQDEPECYVCKHRRGYKVRSRG